MWLLFVDYISLQSCSKHNTTGIYVCDSSQVHVHVVSQDLTQPALAVPYDMWLFNLPLLTTSHEM